MNNPMKRSIAYTLAFILIWAAWFFLCPNYLRILEAFDFFTTLPDYRLINLEIPKPAFMGISAFLLQFYAVPAAGAAIQALLTILLVLCVDALIRGFFKDADRLHWISFIVAPFFTVLLCKELVLTGALIWLTATAAAVCIVRLATLKVKPMIPLPKVFRSCWAGATVIAVSIAASGYVIYNSHVKGGAESMSHLDHLVGEKQWEEILDTVSPQDAIANEYMRKCALLALVQTDQLAEKAFIYGLSGINDFFYHKTDNAMLRSFNMKFYGSLDMHSPAVYYSYQQATQFILGMSFNAARSLADIYLKVKDYALAKKYLEILSHTSCHGKWVKDRLPELEAIKDSTPAYAEDPTKDLFGSFQYDLPVMMNRYPEDSRYLHMYLCGLLAEKQGGVFYKVFCDTLADQYTDGKPMPKVYQEAVLMALSSNPEDKNKYNIDKDIQDNFLDFAKLVGSGKDGVARRKYAGTYWAYLYFNR